MSKTTPSELAAVQVASFAASCAQTKDWKSLETMVLSKLQSAEERGARRKLRELKAVAEDDGTECPICGICP